MKYGFKILNQNWNTVLVVENAWLSLAKINLIMIMSYEKNSDSNKYIDSKRVIILWEVSKGFFSQRFDMFVAEVLSLHDNAWQHIA